MDTNSGMFLAQVTTDQLVQGFGLPAALVIVGLLTALIYYVRQNDIKDKKILSLYDTRVQEATQVNEKLTTPMNELTELSRKTYDVLLNINTKRGR